MKKVFSVLAYIHSKDIVHRDIKLENIMIEKIIDYKVPQNSTFDVKVVDFGFACNTNEMKFLEFLGTPCYQAP